MNIEQMQTVLKNINNLKIDNFIILRDFNFNSFYVTKFHESYFFFLDCVI